MLLHPKIYTLLIIRNVGKLFEEIKDQLRWLNTVLWMVSGNLRDGACFKLDKQTCWRKSNGTQKMISQNLLIKVL